MSGFVHLRLHTEYSLTDSIVRVEPPKRKGGGSGGTLTQAVAAHRQPAVALTDRMNLFAMVKVYKAAESAGIKAIVGADVWLAERSKGDGHERLTLLVQNDIGYRNLTRLLSRGYTEGQSRGTPLLERAWLAETSEGLIALTGRDGGAFRAAAADNVDAALASLNELKLLYPGRLYLEISRCQRPGDESWVTAAVALSRHRELPLVATNDVRFIERKDFAAHEARVCIAQGRVINDDKRPRDYTEEQYIKSSEEMCELFADLPEAVENTLQIARRCTLSLQFGTYYLPDYPVPEGHDTNSWLKLQAHEGLTRRFSEITPYAAEEVYRARLDYELGVIETMQFPGYFLVVADFIQWAKANGCPVGPGRGSGAGSLVAYSIGVTDLDPLPYNLLFERFLNPERVSMPDFDIDFCMDNRDRVIEYVGQKYGRERVGQIVTYATMAARGVVRDVTRVLGHGYGFGDRLAKLIPGTPGATLADAVEEIPELKAAYEGEEDVHAVLDLALELEGITRGVGVHAGGVVIAPRPLTDFAPLLCEAGGTGMRTQFDMKDLEAIGLVKFDFLGLKTLTVIQEAVENIEKSRNEKLEILKLPIDDAKTYSLYASGDTTAVFQMESPGMQKASRDLKPDTFEDIIALVSLYRPGPMELIPEYCARKRGDSPVEYLHPAMETVLSPTYGIFVYQEQVMQMSQRLAGYTLGGADLLRRAMGKKKADEMAQQRAIFTEGSEKNGVSGETASAVFDLMEKFANYGFNKSHAAAYALVSYQTAWLKTHYPAEFMAAVLSCEMAHTDSVVTMLDECRRMKLIVHPPHINRSYLRFTVPAPGEIAYGLSAIKGVGEGAVEGIVAEREARGPYIDLFDFCSRIDVKRANKRVLEALICSGALDAFGMNRPSLMATLPKALQLAEKAAQSASSGIFDMFGLGDAGNAVQDQVQASSLPDWSPHELLDKERETLGFYLSGHPIEAWQDVISPVCSGTLRELIHLHAQPAPVNAEGKAQWQPRIKCLFGAWVTDLRFFKGDGKFSRASYKITLDDRSAQISTWIDADKWARFQTFVKLDSLIFVNAEISLSPGKEGREAEPRLYNPEFYSPAQLMNDYATRLTLSFRRSAREVTELRKLLTPYKSDRGAAVTVEYANPRARTTLDFAADWRVRVEPAVLEALHKLLGVDCVKVAYKRYQAPVPERRFDSNRSFAGAAADDE
ncbi:MAG: polymerase subunit alpha [Hydrocarboniphaga sp.]|uniref:DNA polymerase III subunit alpha n=1 Tax=Hydrocarboniphaga sp. TaxID=2033016 RepID=UPI0026087AAB|nr:DNA polymerase III subunit alpha [Hydrocarboniphaga sp.]MDB5968972.1 polymerase subunit alpha [Hydrocarboniphaga sp.]